MLLVMGVFLEEEVLGVALGGQEEPCSVEGVEWRGVCVGGCERGEWLAKRQDGLYWKCR